MGTNRPSEVLSGDLDFYTVYTLIDITDTGVTDPRGTTMPFKQAQNLNSIFQALGMRTQLVLSSVNKMEDQDLADYNFGINYEGNHTVWIFKFASETAGAWKKGDNPVYHAEIDVQGVPVYTDLQETVSVNDFFDFSDNISKNIYIISSENL